MPKPIIFLHIPKTAGTTLRSVIRKQYPDEAIRGIRAFSATELRTSVEECRNMKPAQRQVISGHMIFGAHRYLGSSYQYVTVVRDPVDRVISDYRYVLRTPTHDYFEPVATQKYSLEDYVVSGISIYTDNIQTRMLAGTGGEVHFGKCTDDMYKTARQNVDGFIACVGITERFDESLILMKRKFGWTMPVYCARNRAKMEETSHGMSRRVLKIIRHRNCLDVALYDYIGRRFQEELNRQDGSFDYELKKLVALNAIYAPTLRAYVSLRRVRNKIMRRQSW